MAALATLLIAYVAWVLCQLAIDRHLQDVGAGPKLPGTDDDTESAPGSRLQTMLPLLSAAFGILVAVIAALIMLSRLGIDTAPLIGGAGVFSLAISFGSQSLVRDIISGLFYMWGCNRPEPPPAAPTAANRRRDRSADTPGRVRRARRP